MSRGEKKKRGGSSYNSVEIVKFTNHRQNTNQVQKNTVQEN